MAKRVFIIYGRDTEARDELVKFIRAIGLEEIPFESVANSLGPSPFVADVVIKGMEQADAVVALFTPDEHAALYDPITGTSLADTEGGFRWQARPNVLFEAGVAYGQSNKNLILTVIGADVRLFSDVSGVHFIQLDRPDGKRNLFERLETLLGPLAPAQSNWETSRDAGDFVRCIRQRWRFFDEVSELLRYFENRLLRLKKQTISLADIVRSVITAEPRRNWSVVNARDFMEAVERSFGNSVTDNAYWWLVVYGFFQFDNIDYWGTIDDATWDDSVDEARLAPRGAALLDRIRALAT